MNAEIWVAIITGLASLVGVIVTVICGNKQHAKTSEEQTKLTLYRIDQLEKKVELHNNAVERLFIAEGKISELQHEMVQIHNKEIAS